MNIKTLLIGVLVLLAPDLVQAMHIIGGEITYRCLGDGNVPNSRRFEFTMKIYRDCNGGGAPFDGQAAMAIYTGSYDINQRTADFFVPLSSDIPINPNDLDCIENPPNPCVEEGTYIFTRDLPILTNQSYFIVYQRCCRNVTIRNIVNPGDIGATYMVEITPKAMEFCNNSPTFDNFPPTVVCNQFPINYSSSATDIDGDQLVYSFCSPWAGGGPILTQPQLNSCNGAQPIPPCSPPFDDVPFIVPNYTPGAPMGGNPVIAINPQTGFISGSPDINGQFVVGICVEEYRNGVLLSTIKREFQFNVTDCMPTLIASLAQTDSVQLIAQRQYRVKACGTNTVNFDNKSTQLQFIDTYAWYFDVNGTTVAYDDFNPVVTFPDTGQYTGMLVLNPGDICNDTAFITVDIFPGITADFSYAYDTCVAGPVQFTSLSQTKDPKGIVDYFWDFGSGTGTSDSINPSQLYPIPGTHNVVHTVTDSNRCVKTAIKPIEYLPAPATIIVEPDEFFGCIPDAITFTNLSTPIDSTYYIRWDYGDGTSDEGIISPTHNYVIPGLFDVAIDIVSPIGCAVSDTFFNLIRMEPSPTAGFIFTPDAEEITIFNNTIQIIDQSIDAKFWNYTFGDFFNFSNDANPSYSFPDTGAVRILQVVTHESGCKDTLSRWIDVPPVLTWFMPNAFSPNNDSVNEGFAGKGFIEGSTDFSMTIWNRWGELVYETNDSEAQWNGRDKNVGAEAPQGVYVYLVTFTGPRGQEFEYRGFATLIR